MSEESHAFGFLLGLIELRGLTTGEAAEVAVQEGYDDEVVEELLEEHFR